MTGWFWARAFVLAILYSSTIRFAWLGGWIQVWISVNLTDHVGFHHMFFFRRSSHQPSHHKKTGLVKGAGECPNHHHPTGDRFESPEKLEWFFKWCNVRWTPYQTGKPWSRTLSGTSQRDDHRAAMMFQGNDLWNDHGLDGWFMDCSWMDWWLICGRIHNKWWFSKYRNAPNDDHSDIYGSMNIPSFGINMWFLHPLNWWSMFIGASYTHDAWIPHQMGRPF